MMEMYGRDLKITFLEKGIIASQPCDKYSFSMSLYIFKYGSRYNAERWLTIY